MEGVGDGECQWWEVKKGYRLELVRVWDYPTYFIFPSFIVFAWRKVQPSILPPTLNPILSFRNSTLLIFTYSLKKVISICAAPPLQLNFLPNSALHYRVAKAALNRPPSPTPIFARLFAIRRNFFAFVISFQRPLSGGTGLTGELESIICLLYLPSTLHILFHSFVLISDPVLLFCIRFVYSMIEKGKVCLHQPTLIFSSSLFLYQNWGWRTRYKGPCSCTLVVATQSQEPAQEDKSQSLVRWWNAACYLTLVVSEESWAKESHSKRSLGAWLTDPQQQMQGWLCSRLFF